MYSLGYAYTNKFYLLIVKSSIMFQPYKSATQQTMPSFTKARLKKMILLLLAYQRINVLLQVKPLP